MATQKEKFQEIADAIRNVNGRTNNCTIVANDFSAEIAKLDPKIVPYAESFENGYYGLRAAKCASTYLLARVLGTDKFTYNTVNIFSSSTKVRYGEYARIDCSTYIGLCLRGITYENSPYAKHIDDDAIWTPSAELSDMYGTDGWEFKELDYQADGLFNNIGISGYSTIRVAADLGQYFYKNGLILYSKDDGILSSVSDLDLQAGDLVFWDTSDNVNVDDRFMSISHVAMVAENTSYYYHVTGTEETFGQTVVNYVEFGSDSNHPISSIVLICRPDYRPRMPKEETPIGTNLLEYPWTYSRNASYTKNGLTLTLVDKNTINVDGTSTENTTILIKGYNSSNNHITLSAGTYELTGIPSDYSGTSFALQVRDSDGNDFDTQIRYPTGSNSINTFTITEETDVIVKLYCKSEKTIDNATVVPTLTRKI